MLKPKKNHQHKTSHLHLLGALAWLTVVFLSSSHPVAASTPNSSFIQSYSASTTIQQGMIVELQQSNSNAVEPASQNNIYRTFGVVVNLANASIAVENVSNQTNQVFVANSGHYSVLVSDQNGPILAGDYITLSPVDGIGMKDNTAEPIIIAQALSSFNGTGPLIGTDTVKTSSGVETIHLGLIDASISIAHNPLLINANNDVPKVLSSFSQTITGKIVSPWRIWLGVSVMAVVAFIVGSMLYGAVRSGIISIGRNPLSKKVITKGFLDVVISALIIFTSAVFGVYLLLKV